MLIYCGMSTSICYLKKENMICRTSSLIVLTWLTMAASPCACFVSPRLVMYWEQEHTSTSLSMGKSRNKQADLRRKMELAKQQKEEVTSSGGGQAKEKPLTDEEIRERNDRLRFEELLKKEGATMLNDYSSQEGYLNKNQEEDEIIAYKKGADRLFENDPAPTECFERLIDVTTEKSLAKKGSQHLVPWLTAGLDEHDYRVIICDPRPQSLEFHQAITDLNAALPNDIKDRLYYINADTPAENRRWMKKKNIEKLQLFCDTESKDWMRTYTALGDKRWSMTMFVIAQGKVMKIARDLDIYNISRTVVNAIKSMKKDLRTSL